MFQNAVMDHDMIASKDNTSRDMIADNENVDPDLTSETDLSMNESQISYTLPDSSSHGMFYIDKSGKCSVCNNDDAYNEAVECFLCEEKFHALCRNTQGIRPDAICVPSFYELFQPYHKK